MLQRWQAVSNNVSDLTGPRFEPQTSRSRDERVTARLTGANLLDDGAKKNASQWVKKRQTQQEI